MLAYQPFLKLAGACALLAITGVSLASCGDRCRALPAAKTAGWEAGDEREPTGTSTDSRIKGAGEQSWALALDLLRITDPGEHPSIASSPASMTFGLGLAYARWPQACHGTILAAIHALESGDALHQTLGASIRELGSDGG